MAVPAHPSVPQRVPRRYLRPPVPLHFPVDEQMPEGMLHRLLMNRLWLSVENELAGRALISSDQFLYWDPTDPKKCLAPDVAVQLGGHPAVLKSWKTWELGAPHVAVEIVSDSDRAARDLELKLARYRQAGIAELARFDSDDAATPLRLWDLIDGDLVERDMSDPEATRCDALGLYWCVVRDPQLGPTLRLAHDRGGERLVPTTEEAARAREVEGQARELAAQARIAELEAALRTR